jgi:PTS system galactitol-specific IIB component
MKIMIACGSGVATSTIMASRVKSLLEKHNLKADIIQCSMTEVSTCNPEDTALIVTSLGKLQVKDIPVVVAIPYISGVGGEAVDEKIVSILKERLK